MSGTPSVSSGLSSTISAFARRRFTGEVAIFGGDFRTGAKELSEAVVNSTQAQVSRALQNITQTLARLENKSQSLPANRLLDYEESIDRPMQLMPTTLEHKAVATVDLDKIEALHDDDLLSHDDLDAYRVMLRTLQKPPKSNKPVTVEPQVVNPESTITDDIVQELCASKQEELGRLSQQLNMTDYVGHMCLSRAVIHDSIFAGSSTNRSLAMLGTSAISLLLRQKALADNKSVGETSHLMQIHTSKDALCVIGVRHHLDDCIIAGLNVNTRSRNVLGTAVQAILGACYYVNGMNGIRHANELFDIIK